MSDEKILPITKAQFDLLVGTNAAINQAMARGNLLQAMLFAQHGVEGNWQIVGLEDGDNPHATIRQAEPNVGVGSL